MEINLLFLVGICFSILGAVILRIEMMYRNACREIGRQIVSKEYLSVNPNGHQDALTNPKRNKFFIIGAGLVVISPFVSMAGDESANYWMLLVSFLSLIFTGVILSNKLSTQHYLPVIYADLVKRAKIFERQGDVVRSKAAEDVSNLMLDEYEYLQILTPSK